MTAMGRWIAVLALALWAAPAGGELAILTDGGVLKVHRWQVGEGSVRLELASGGAITVALERLERIVDDEVEETAAQPLAELVIALDFRPDHPVPEGPHGKAIWEAARRQGLNPRLVDAVMRAESAGDPLALSPKGARGLMQLMPATALRFGVAATELWQPEPNLAAGTGYLRALIDRFEGDLARVLAAYNAGEATVERYDGVPPYRETREYIRRVYRMLGADEATATVAARGR